MSKLQYFYNGILLRTKIGNSGNLLFNTKYIQNILNYKTKFYKGSPYLISYYEHKHKIYVDDKIFTNLDGLKTVLKNAKKKVPNVC